MSKEKSRNLWPGQDERSVVAEMLKNPKSAHWNECRSFLMRLVNASNLPSDLKEDAVQSAMVSVIRNLSNFHYQCKLTTWLGIIANTRVIDLQRDQTRESKWISPQIDHPEDAEIEVDRFTINTSKTTEEESLIREELREVLNEMQNYIKSHANPIRNRRILQMVLFEGYSIEETARQLGVPAPVVGYVVRSIQHYLREKMRHEPSLLEPIV